MDNGAGASWATRVSCLASRKINWPSAPPLHAALKSFLYLSQVSTEEELEAAIATATVEKADKCDCLLISIPPVDDDQGDCQ